MTGQNIKNADFAITLVNYRTPTITPVCLDLLKEFAQKNGVQVWVVDNNSGDESTRYLRSLNWIKLIERVQEPGETGAIAHGRALDLVLQRVDVDYLFLLHTDTFVHRTDVFDLLMQRIRAGGDRLVAVGCLDQIDRGAFRTHWRQSTRFIKHHVRTLKLKVGLKSRQPKPYKEIYLKSFCALWNIKTVKEMGLTFSESDRTPGYEIQDRLTKLGYRFEAIPERLMFSYLDHIEAGTISAIGGYSPDHRRLKKYQTLLAKMKDSQG